MLAAPGAKDGVVKVVREGGAGVAYQWSGAECGMLLLCRALRAADMLCWCVMWSFHHCVFTGSRGRRSAP